MLKPEAARRPWTVSELAREIQRELRPLAQVFVKGEISGMKQSAKGHYTFTVKDGQSVIEAFIWQQDARRLAMLPEDGQEFILRGKVDFWAQAGRVRLVVDYVEFDDAGKLRARYELLKQRLELEGAFEPARKRPLPFLPRAVGLITSPAGAVIHDLQQTILDRFPNMDMYVYPALVQGAAAPASIAGALRQANREGLADVLVIARGGGSFEELYSFNLEPVVRAILASRLPVVTALGHTSDRTLADLAADAECRTPTEAGARVVPRKSDLAAQLRERARRVEREGLRRMDTARQSLQHRGQRLAVVLPALIAQRKARLERCRADLARLSPANQLTRRLTELGERGRRLEQVAGRLVPARRLDLEHRLRRLQALSPDRVLTRGYSITQDAETGAVITASDQARAGGRLRIRLARGRLGAIVEAVEAS
jgi:exodeoxyribonuclease VII large subunit